MATTDKQYLSVVYTSLTNSLEEQVKALPADFNKTRFVQNCMTLMQDGKTDYSRCEPRSLVRTLMKASYLGLDFFMGECYAIPYGTTVNFQTDYKGERKLAMKYSKIPIKEIYAKVVREGDEFTEKIIDGKQSIDFTPKPFSTAKIIGAFAVVNFMDGSMAYETMSKEQIETVRGAFSKAANSPAWKNTPEEMYKKTVIRRLLKSVPLNFDNAKQIEAFNEGGDAEFGNKVPHEETVDALRDKPKDDIVEEPAPEQPTEEVDDAEFEVTTDENDPNLPWNNGGRNED